MGPCCKQWIIIWCKRDVPFVWFFTGLLFEMRHWICRMTRKARSRLQRGNDTAVPLQNSAIVSGYCEICQLTFVDQKKHLQSDRHTQFVGNRNNFLALDQLINRGPTMDTFLKLNGADQIRYSTESLYQTIAFLLICCRKIIFLKSLIFCDFHCVWVEKFYIFNLIFITGVSFPPMAIFK